MASFDDERGRGNEHEPSCSPWSCSGAGTKSSYDTTAYDDSLEQARTYAIKEEARDIKRDTMEEHGDNAIATTATIKHDGAKG
jgi:hypothetical protein